MNENQPLPPRLTSPLIANPPEKDPAPADPETEKPIHGIACAIESILRNPERLLWQLRNAPGPITLRLTAGAIVAGALYGIVVGSFSGGAQLWAAPAKIAGGLFLSALICLPSLYIFSCLGGSKARLAEVTGLLAGLLALMTVLLIGFAPVAWVFSQSTESAAVMGTLHFLFWFVATYFATRFLKRGFAELSGEPQGVLNMWILIFVMVMLQMTTALRPIIGKSDRFLPAEKKFFLTHWVDSLQQAGTGANRK